ncbi:MAG TPA: portal protein, partial [Alphaproteobacteria bacterium]|nr:portal protein [Alphaproteobacteria bacterium]
DAIDEILRQHDALKAERAPGESHWQTIADHVLPRRGDFAGRRADGGRRADRIFDPNGQWANEQLAAGLHGMLTNPAVRWFGLKARDERLNRLDGVKRWLETVTDALYGVFNSPRVNFHPQAHELYLDLGAFGTAALLIDEHPVFGPTFATRALGECFIAEGADGRVDALHREFRLTARQAVGLWGAAVPEAVGRAAATDPGRKFTFVHAVRPRGKRDPFSRLSGDKPWASVYFSLDFKQPISAGGYDEFPYVVPRWSKATGETYGRSQAMTALPTILLVDGMMKTVIVGAQKMVDPPLMAPDDGFVRPIKASPGRVIFYRAGTPQYDRIQPLTTGGNPGLGLDMIELQRRQILQIFHVDLMQTEEGPRMTATEVLQRREKRHRLLGPIVARQETEYLNPLIERTLSILTRRRQLPPPPDELWGREIEVEYTSPIQQAQKAVRTESMARVLEAAERAASYDPGVLALIDTEAMVREVAVAVTGAGDGEAALAALTADPAALVKFQTAAMAFELRLHAEDTRRLQAVNETIRSETASADAYVRRMRPTFGYVMAASFAGQMGALAWLTVRDPGAAASVAVALADLTWLWGIGLSVLGVYVYKRSEEKRGPGGSDLPGIPAVPARRFDGH